MIGAEALSARGRGALAAARAHWWYVAAGALVLLLPILVAGGVSLPFGVSFGFKSFARNVALIFVLGVLLRADGLAWAGSALLGPMLAFLGAIALSVWWNGGIFGEVRLFAIAVGLFVGARSLASSQRGYDLLFHWMGLLVTCTVAAEIVANPAILAFREELRNSLVTSHPNTLGFFFAFVSPLFVAAALLRRRPLEWLYALCTLVGVGVTFSRSAWFAWIVGAILVSFGLGRRSSWRGRLVVAGMVSSAALVVIGFLSLNRSEADLQRLRILEASLSLFREHWLFGIGYGITNLGHSFPARYRDLFGTELFLFHSHNLYIDVLAGAGIVGSVALAVLLGCVMRIAWRAFACARTYGGASREGVGFAAQVAVFLLLGLVDMPLFHPKILFPLALLWGMMEAQVAASQPAILASRRLLRTARLSLQPVQAEDVDSLHRHWNVPDVRRYLWDDLPVARSRVEEVVRASASDFARAGYGLWALRLLDAPGLVGVCGLRQVAGTDWVEALYSLDRSLWGEGLATEAARTVLAYGFEELGLARIVGGTDEPNTASRRVLEKLSMSYHDRVSSNGTSVVYLAVTRESFAEIPSGAQWRSSA